MADFLLRQEPDRRLARKLLAVRALFLLLAVLCLVLVGMEAASGTIVVSSNTSEGGRSAARLRELDWADSPWLYVLGNAWHACLALVFVVGMCLAVETLVRRWHGRPFFKRKYPY